MNETIIAINNRESSPPPCIAIVGASFGGLALANYLEQEQFVYEIFESKTAPIPICGPIRLSHGRQVLSELGLQLEERKIQRETTGAMVVEQEEFRNLLRSRVRHKIHYSCAVIRVEKRQARQYFLHKKNQKGPLGPFHTVVAADGLFGLTSMSRTDDIPPLVIGDARWQHDMWFWDFGRRRRKQGADIALVDALELGKGIVDGKQLEAKKFTPSSPPRILLLIRGKLGLFSIPVIVGIFLQFILQAMQGETNR